MILDEDVEQEAIIAEKARKRTEDRLQRKQMLPDTNAFKSQIIDFKERLMDSSIPNKFDRNILNFKPTRTKTRISIDLGNSEKLTLGVQRDKKDLNGNRYDSG